MPQLCDINPYIRRARYDVIQTPWNLTERIIYDYELLYIKEGNFHITIEDQTFDAQTGELYLFHPGQRHAIQVLEEGYVIQPHLHFDLFLYPDREQVGISFLNRSDMNEEQLAQIRPDTFSQMFPFVPSRMKLPNPEYVESLLFDIISQYESDSPFRELNLKWMFIKLLSYLVQTTGDKGLQRIGNSDIPLLTQRIRTWLDMNLDHRISMKELGDTFHLNSDYLSRLFRKVYKVTPTHYHLMQRLYRSRELLQYTNISVADVAARLGFLSVNDFSRAFKKNLGISPSLVKQQGYLATRKEEKMPERLIYFEKEDRKVEKC